MQAYLKKLFTDNALTHLNDINRMGKKLRNKYLIIEILSYAKNTSGTLHYMFSVCKGYRRLAVAHHRAVLLNTCSIKNEVTLDLYD